MKNSSTLISIFNSENEVNLSFSYPDEITINTINALFSKILAQNNKIFILDTITTILREIILNAVKANAKRIFFEENKIDLNDEKAYSKGMITFKKKIVSKLESIKDRLCGSKYKILVKIEKSGNDIEISITNNIFATDSEIERINFRIIEAMNCNNFSEIYDKVYDPLEGAGLGIVLTVLLLKNAGIDSDKFSIRFEDGKTEVKIVIPEYLRDIETINYIKEKILEEVETLPTFPENIIELQQICKNPDSSIENIAIKISNDPALTADVLKIANSAGFITGKRIASISEAVMIIGLKNLELILMTSVARKIIDKRYKKFEKIWAHCNKTAFYARMIAIEFNLPKIIDSVFISGLLHDIGKIVLLSTDLDFLNQISQIVSNKKIRSSTILEEISIGISHSTIGALIAEKWNFPAYLIDAIQWHHAPLSSDKSIRDIVEIVYLANKIVGIENLKYNFHYIESEILDKYNLNDEEKFKLFSEKLRRKFEDYNPGS